MKEFTGRTHYRLTVLLDSGPD